MPRGAGATAFASGFLATGFFAAAFLGAVVRTTGFFTAFFAVGLGAGMVMPGMCPACCALAAVPTASAIDPTAAFNRNPFTVHAPAID